MIDLYKDASFNNSQLILFLLCILTSYILYRNFALQMDWRHNIRSCDQIYSDISYLLFLSTVLFFFGNYNNTFDTYTVIGLLVGLFGFGAIGQTPYLQNNLSNMETWSSSAWIAYGIGTLIVIIIILYHVELVNDEGYTGNYVLTLLIPIMFGTLAYYTTNMKGSKIKFHPHHWFIFYALAFFTRFDTVLSQLSAGLSIGVFVHGVSAYGADRAFF